MKKSSYGIFTIEQVNENDPSDVITNTGFNSFTEAGYDRLIAIMSGAIDEKFSNYIKVGNGPNNYNYAYSTDIQNPVYGYNDPNAGFNKDNFLEGNYILSNFARSALPPGQYTEIGIYWKETPVSTPVLLAAANVKFTVSVGYKQRLSHAVFQNTNNREFNLGSFILEDDVGYKRRIQYSATWFDNIYNISRVILQPENCLVIGNKASAWGLSHLVGRLKISEPNSAGNFIIQVKLTNDRSSTVEIDEIYVNSNDILLENENWDGYGGKHLVIKLDQSIFIEPGKTICVDFNIKLNLDSQFTQLNVNWARSTLYNVDYYNHSYRSGESSPSWYYRNGDTATNTTRSGYWTTTYNSQSLIPNNDVGTVSFGGVSRVLPGNRETEGDIVTAWVNYNTKEIHVSEIPNNLAYFRVFTDLPRSTLGFEANAINNVLNIPPMLNIGQRMFIQHVYNDGTKGIISQVMTEPVSTDTLSKFGFSIYNENKLLERFIYNDYYNDPIRWTLAMSVVEHGIIKPELDILDGTSIEWQQSLNKYDISGFTHIIKRFKPDPINQPNLYHYEYIMISEIPRIESVTKDDLMLDVTDYNLPTIRPIVEPKFGDLGIPYSNFEFYFPDNGKVVWVVSRPNGEINDVGEITGVKGEKASVNIDSLFNPHTCGCLLAYFEKNGVRSEPYIVRNGTQTLPMDPIFEYDPINNKFVGPIPQYTFKIAIKRHNVPVVEYEIDMDRIWFDNELPFLPDSDKQYQVYAVTKDGYYCENPLIINPDVVDILPPPIINLSKPDEFNVPTGSGYGDNYPKPNFLKYGTESFAGEINDEPIIEKTIIQYSDRIWLCEVATLNYSARWYINKGWESRDITITVGDKAYTKNLVMYNNGFSVLSKIVMWTTWLEYDKVGFDCFITSDWFERYYFCMKPFVNSSQNIASTLYEQNGYYRQIVVKQDSSSYYTYWPAVPKIYNHDAVFESNPHYTAWLSMKLTKDSLAKFLITIDGETPVITRVLEGNEIVKTVLTTSKYTFEHDYIPGSKWVLTRHVDPIDSDTVIKIRMGHTVAVETNSSAKWPYFSNDNGFFVNPDYINYLPEWGGYLLKVRTTDGWLINYSFYYKPVNDISPKKLDILPSWNNPSIKDLRVTLYSNNTGNPLWTTKKFYIDQTEATVIHDPITDSYSISTNDVKFSMVRAPDNGMYFDITLTECADNLSHDLVIASTSYESGWISTYDNNYLSSRNEWDGYWAIEYRNQLARFSMDGIQTTPLTWKLLPDVVIDPSDINDVFVMKNNNWSSIQNDVIATINGIPAQVYSWYSIDENRSVELAFTTAEDPDNLTEDDITIILDKNSFGFISTWKTKPGIYEVQVQEDSLGYTWYQTTVEILSQAFNISSITTVSRDNRKYSKLGFILDTTTFETDLDNIVWTGNTYSDREYLVDCYTTINYDYLFEKYSQSLYDEVNEIHPWDDLDDTGILNYLIEHFNTWVADKLDVKLNDLSATVEFVFDDNPDTPWYVEFNNGDSIIRFNYYANKWLTQDNDDIMQKCTLEINVLPIRNLIDDRSDAYFKDYLNQSGIFDDFDNISYSLERHGYFYKSGMKLFLGYEPPIIIDPEPEPIEDGELPVYPPNPLSVDFALDGGFDIYIDGEWYATYVDDANSFADDINWNRDNTPEFGLEATITENEIGSARYNGHTSGLIEVEGNVDIYINDVLAFEDMSADDINLSNPLYGIDSIVKPPSQE